MKKIIGHKQGYRIIISDGFYEVIEGRRVVYFGECNKSATIQEIANKTISVKEKSGNVNHRGKRFGEVIRKEVSRGSMCRSEADEGENVVGF